MFPKPQSEHDWLRRLVGTWTFESTCYMGPDQPPSKTTGQVSCRSLGGLWIILDTQGASPDGGSWSSIMTLGYDPASQRHLGTFVASMMTHLWLYSGSIDKSSGKLVLDTEGPRFDQSGMSPYQDIFELVDRDRWILSSQIQNEDGTWLSFMTAEHRRAGND